MKTKKTKSNNGSSDEQLTAEEKMFADQVAAEFVLRHRMISTDKKLLFLWDGNCYRTRSREYLEHLVQPDTPSYLRNTFHHVINNIIIRTYVEADRLQSAYCFDENGHMLVNSANGILRWHRDPDTGVWRLEGKLEPPNPQLFFTGALAANYDPSAKCPITDRALQGIQPDKRDREALWYFGAYVLIPDCRLEQCMFWKGLGEAGKGTAVKIYTSPLGEDLITNQDMSILGDAKRYGLSLLKYAMLNLSSELSDRVIDDTSIWKKLVVGEYETQRNLYEQYGKLKSSCKHIIQGNNLPNLKKATDADVRRILPIAFTQKFSKEDRDVELKDIKIPAERDGHLAQMVKRVAPLLSLSALPVGGQQSVALTHRMSVRLRSNWLLP
jgi:phage/plasmid-associated DNA primase